MEKRVLSYLSTDSLIPRHSKMGGEECLVSTVHTYVSSFVTFSVHHVLSLKQIPPTCIGSSVETTIAHTTNGPVDKCVC